MLLPQRLTTTGRFAPIETDVDLNVVFETSPSDKAADFVKAKGQYPMEKVGTDDVGFAQYRIDLKK